MCDISAQKKLPKHETDKHRPEHENQRYQANDLFGK